MNNKQLLYFITIVEEGSITNASKKLYISQPYLSLQLKELEEELGLELVSRTTRSLKVTEAGKLLFYRAKQLLDLSKSTIKELNDFKIGVNGIIRIGSISSVIETILLNKIYEFHKKYENIDFEIRQNSTSKILELVERGIIEIGVIRSPLNSTVFNTIALPKEPMVAIVHSNESLGTSNKTVSLDELSRYPLLVHRKYSKEITDSFFRKGLKPRILCEIEDTRPLLTLAEKKMGIAIIPKDWSKVIPKSDLKFYEIPELKINSSIVIVWLNNHYLTTATKTFLDFFKKNIIDI